MEMAAIPGCCFNSTQPNRYLSDAPKPSGLRSGLMDFERVKSEEMEYSRHLMVGFVSVDYLVVGTLLFNLLAS